LHQQQWFLLVLIYGCLMAWSIFCFGFQFFEWQLWGCLRWMKQLDSQWLYNCKFCWTDLVYYTKLLHS
jgi:hypothetical protein